MIIDAKQFLAKLSWSTFWSFFPRGSNFTNLIPYLAQENQKIIEKEDNMTKIESQYPTELEEIQKSEDKKSQKVQQIPASPKEDSKSNENSSQKTPPIIPESSQAQKSSPTKQEKAETNSTKLDCASISKSSAAGSSFTKSQRRKSFPRFPKKRRGSLKESSLFSCIMPKVKDTEDASITSLKSAIPKSSRYEEKSSCFIM